MSRDVDKFISGAVQTFFSSLTSHCVCIHWSKRIVFLRTKILRKFITILYLDLSPSYEQSKQIIIGSKYLIKFCLFSYHQFFRSAVSFSFACLLTTECWRLVGGNDDGDEVASRAV